MERLPPEISLSIVEALSPASVVALSRTTSGLQEITLGTVPQLVLPSEYVLPWNIFAASRYSEIQGEGSLRMPADDRMIRASRRVRGNLQLELLEDDPWPKDLFRCALVRILLYPQSRFRVWTPDELDPEESVGIQWNSGTLRMNFSSEEWERRDVLRFLSSIPMQIFDPGATDLNTEAGITERDFAYLLKRIQFPSTLHTVVFRSDFYFPLPPTVSRIEIESRMLRWSIGDDGGTYNRVRELVVRNFTEEDVANFNSFRVTDSLPGLQRIVFRVDPGISRSPEGLESITREIHGLGISSEIQIFVLPTE